MPHTDTGVTRRDFLKATAVSAGALTLAGSLPLSGATRSPRQCILLFLTGGPSHLDTWDPKPYAPDDVRGPFRSIRTTVNGMHLSENFPLMAKQAQRFAVLRSVHHLEAPIHETGQQLMQTGRLVQNGVDHPHYGAVLSHLYGPSRKGVPPWVVLPGPIFNTGVSVGHGQSAGYLGAAYEPQLVETIDTSREKASVRERYGADNFGQSCLAARRLIEDGVRLVTVNMFDSVFDKITWDCHADGGALGTDLDDYGRVLCPLFDRAYTTLLDDLTDRGMFDDTLVLAMGEFGRTPKINPRGGRDHWPGCWSILAAGGGIRGGQVIGSSDSIGAEPKDRPITPAEIAATVYATLGVDPATRLPGPDGEQRTLTDAVPIRELF